MISFENIGGGEIKKPLSGKMDWQQHPDHPCNEDGMHQAKRSHAPLTSPSFCAFDGSRKKTKCQVTGELAQDKGTGDEHLIIDGLLPIPISKCSEFDLAFLLEIGTGHQGEAGRPRRLFSDFVIFDVPSSSPLLDWL